ncbi:MAG: hypothetical protein MJZ76_08740 [Bacteroidales bacterium]|nr:hypothetical protein [Bacteroidales bacterium]
MKLIKYLLFLMMLVNFVGCDDEIDGDVGTGGGSDRCRNSDDPLCRITKDSGRPNTQEPIVNDIYGGGDVEEFEWEETLSWFLEADNYKYGYDRDPLSNLEDYIDRGKDVYVSVEEKADGKSDGLARVVLYVDPNSKDEYVLYRKKGNDIKGEKVKTGKEICKEGSVGIIKCMSEVYLPAGDYAVFYGDVDKERYLHIIEYKMKTLNVDYVEFGDADNYTCFAKGDVAHEKNGCYTFKNVKRKFNDIFAQAVMDGNINSKKPSEIGLDEIMVVDLTEESMDTEDGSFDTDRHLDKIEDEIYAKLSPDYAKAKKIVEDFYENIEVFNTDYKQYEENVKKIDEKIKGLKEKNASICVDKSIGDNLSYDCSVEIVEEAENNLKEIETKMKEKKELNESFEEKYHVSEVNEASETAKYKRVSSQSFHIALALNLMRIKWDLKETGVEQTLHNYEDFNKACTVENNIPFDNGCNIPFEMWLSSSCKGVADTKITVNVKSKNEKKNSFVAELVGVGTLKSNCAYSIWADVKPFVPGEHLAAQITRTYYQNEDGGKVIGGFVWGSHLNGDASQNTLIHEIGHSFGLTDVYIDPDDPSVYNNIVTDEGNLMFFTIPTGPKLRYRPVDVVCTGSNVKIGDNDYENQWDCIRSSEKCHLYSKKQKEVCDEKIRSLTK